MTEFTPEHAQKWRTIRHNKFTKDVLQNRIHLCLDEIQRLQSRVQELEAEQRWMPVEKWKQEENIDMLIRVVVRDLQRTFTGYLKDGEWKIPLDWANSIPVTWNLVTHVMPLPQPPKEGE